MKRYYLLYLLVFTFLYSCKKSELPPPVSPPADTISFTSAASIGIKGDRKDVTTTALPGYVLMGGSTDVNAAIKWMLDRSNGGDIVVIRATGTDAYDNYMYGLSNVNSVETLLINSISLANDDKVSRTIRDAECLFIAGGDQWDYVSLWKNTKVNEAINYLINTKKVPVGGTSAGCMILGQFCYDAEKGSATSAAVLKNPYDKYVSFTSHFISIPLLQNIITDTHYDNPDRRGRQLGFMARLYQDSSVSIKGIGVEERTAVAIDENGNAVVFGNGHAYFLQANTSLGLPENCKPNNKLTWNYQKQAVSVYTIQGNNNGNGSINIQGWDNFSGGISQTFAAKNGKLLVQ